MKLPTDIRRQIMRAAFRMYRAGVWGQSTNEGEPLGLSDYAADFWLMEDADEWQFGYVDYRDREALVFVVEGIRLLCGVERDNAIRCFEMAVDELKARTKETRR